MSSRLAAGVYAVWRFCCPGCRALGRECGHADTSAMVLTLDSFLMMSRELKAKIIEEAAALADKDGDIAVEDRRHIIFCAIDGLEEVLSISTEDRFLETLKAARDDK